MVEKSPMGQSGPARPRAGRGAGARRPRLVHYTDAEWFAVKEAARLAGKPARRFVRESSLGALAQVPPLLANAPLIRALGRSATALGQLAATARSTGALPPAAALEAAVAELLALVRQVARPTSAPRV